MRLFNYTWKLLLLTSCVLLQGVMVSSCNKDDDDVYPSLRADFYDVLVDHDSIVKDIILDNGKRFKISNTTDIQAFVRDTVVRCYGTIDISADSSSVYVYSLNAARCTAPSTKDNYKPYIYYKYPVNIISVYKARKYINAILSYKLNGKDHAFDFIKDSITTEPDGTRMIHFTFFHWHADEEAEAYTQKLYMCLPLDKSYYKEDEDFDSVEISFTTYEGVKKMKFKR